MEKEDIQTINRDMLFNYNFDWNFKYNFSVFAQVFVYLFNSLNEYWLF